MEMAIIILLAQIAGVFILAYFLFAGFRVLISSFSQGSDGLRASMNDGAGFHAFFDGRLHNGHGSTHLNVGHGLHVQFDSNDELQFERKSKVV